MMRLADRAMLNGFISYSHGDDAMCDGLLRHLAATEERGHVKFWVDKKIAAGRVWPTGIEDGIKAAHVFIMLVSSSFGSSGYIRNTEWPMIRDRAAACNGLVVPLKLKSCEFPFWLEDIQAVPVHRGNLRPITWWKRVDDGYDVAREQLLDAMDKHFPGWRPVRS